MRASQVNRSGKEDKYIKWEKRGKNNESPDDTEDIKLGDRGQRVTLVIYTRDILLYL